jgi:hypothetical protein
MRAMNPEIIPPPISLDKPSLIEHEAEEVLLKSEKQAAFSNPQSWLKTGVVGGIAGILGAALFITLGHILHPLFLTKSPSTPSFSAQFQENIKPIEGQFKTVEERLTALANAPQSAAPALPAPATPALDASLSSVLEARLNTLEKKEPLPPQPAPSTILPQPLRQAIALSVSLSHMETNFTHGQCVPEDIKRLARFGVSSEDVARLGETCERATALGLSFAQLYASLEKDINAFYAAPSLKPATTSEPSKRFWDRFITIRRVEVASVSTPSTQATLFTPFWEALKRGNVAQALVFWEALPATIRDPLMATPSIRSRLESLTAYAQTQEQFAELRQQTLDMLLKEENSP